MGAFLAGLIILLFTLCAIAVKILGIATVIAFILALIGLFGVEMSTAIKFINVNNWLRNPFIRYNVYY